MRGRASSIRFRLTAWYAAALIVILGLLSILVFLFVRGRLSSLYRGKADAGFGTVETILMNSGGDIFDIYHLGHDNAFRLTREDMQPYRTEAWRRLGIEDLEDKGALDRYASFRAPDGRLFIVKVDSIPMYGLELAYAQDATAMEESIRSLAMILLVSFPAALLLAVMGGYLLAGRALSPVDSLTRKARGITADRLSERLPVDNPDDEIGRLAAVFNETLARLESSFERLRRFTADASHELRNPLTSIRSVGEVALQESSDAASYRDAIGSMLEDVDRLTSLVDDLLVLARGDSFKGPVAGGSVDLASLAVGVVEELRILFEDKGQTIVPIPEDTPVMVTADKNTLRLALSNIIHNAIRYAPDGGHIELRIGREGGNAFLDVMDDGPGIPPAERERVFDRFYRLDRARSRAEGGTGLGLSIARWAVETNDGTIAFRDGDLQGACCRVTIPLAGE
jgi:signal transduction histidine kinase